MREFTVGEYKAIVEELREKNEREPETMEIAAACYELGATRATAERGAHE